ncbi:MAG: hypothetical protein AUJ04_09400 [Acidobacteria bacterium 13_1_40CM_3_55_6]|nr:MAG: hypothetical protein AUJ04_09400 [Acidobacteria bacterium 13_1_40CM_3_55_6]
MDTAVLQPAEVQFRAISLEYRLKLNLHAAEADWCLRSSFCDQVRFKLNLHAAKAGGVFDF